MSQAETTAPKFGQVEADWQFSCAAAPPEHRETRSARPVDLDEKDRQVNVPDSAVPQGLDRLDDRHGHKNDSGHQGMPKAPCDPQYTRQHLQGSQIVAQVFPGELQSTLSRRWKIYVSPVRQ